MSFTDEQLLNLVNNSILKKTEFQPEEFTGGSVQVTSTNNHKTINYRVHLFFGYKSKKPITRSIEITQDLYAIWYQAIHVKLLSMQAVNSGMDYSELNELMNGISNGRPTSRPTSRENTTYTNIPIPSTNTYRELEVKNEDALLIAKYLEQAILNYKPNASVRGKHESWYADIEKAMRIDGRTTEQLKGCIDWIYGPDGSFWIPNIQSGKKLREKFDTMEMQMMRTTAPKQKKLSEDVQMAIRVLSKRGYTDDQIRAEVKAAYGVAI